ncbi:hypothetical protein BCR37DRAFT_351637 [Protomyces lactucae-debilis]|uniref:RRM domain-containing protein n=1 Tax=Protomyces lactucae-debilis TaxID=2754530 RepID=A0A1Y2EXZ3_PROLT|nr:uncharacterized protein BCR37DRAFT_351637 [Protomyces lactucae-debilis]ORY76104.1 hypothetical protein BCR37DRAFT_351637 [Protomyces lactucae-debilis]
MSADTAHGPAAQLPRHDPDTRRAVYVGNLPMTMDEDALREIFAVAGGIQSVKLVEKATLNCTLKYAFVEYDDPASAQVAIETLNGRTIRGCVLRVNVAYQSTTIANAREETATHFTLFVGDLAADVRDAELAEAFSAYRSVSDTRVMWDMKTRHSRGYGFVSFRDRSEAERAMHDKTGTYISSRAIRINWANMKQATSADSFLTQSAPGSHILFNIAPANLQAMGVAEQYAIVVLQTSLACSTIYMGNLAADTNKQDLTPMLSAFGLVLELMMYPERGFAFARLDTHEHAALAIVQLQGLVIKGRPLKCSWQTKGERGRQAKRLDVEHPIQSSSSTQSMPTSPQPFSPLQNNYIANMGLGIMDNPSLQYPVANAYANPRSVATQSFYPTSPLSPMMFGLNSPQFQSMQPFEMQMRQHMQQQQHHIQYQMAAQYYQSQGMQSPAMYQDGTMQSIQDQMGHSE